MVRLKSTERAILESEYKGVQPTANFMKPGPNLDKEPTLQRHVCNVSVTSQVSGCLTDLTAPNLVMNQLSKHLSLFTLWGRSKDLTFTL